MGLIERLGRMQRVGKRQCSRLYWRIRAATKKTTLRNGRRQQVKFHYDPYSYALNFDDGFEQEMGGRATDCEVAKCEEFAERKIMVFVILLK